MIYNRELFFSLYREHFGRLRSSQMNGILFLLDKLEHSKRIETDSKRSYVLATVAWETAYSFLPITEYGSDQYLKSKRYYPYIGRGYCQLTWLNNYKLFGSALGIDLVNHPELANERETAWKILEMGMTDNFGIQDPDFTLDTLEDFFYGYVKDFYNARKIINPKDYKSFRPIAIMAENFYNCLEGSLIAADLEPKGLEEIKRA